MIPEIVLFTILQVVNVVLSTIKSIIMIRGNKWAIIISNTIYFGVYTVVLKNIADIDVAIWILTLITMAANFVGTYVGITITDRMKKADLWTISTVVKIEDLKAYKAALNEANLKYISFETTWDGYSAVNILSENRAQSTIIKEILTRFNATYSIQTSHTKL